MESIILLLMTLIQLTKLKSRDMKEKDIPPIILAAMRRSLQIMGYSDKQIKMMKTKDLVKWSGFRRDEKTGNWR